MRHDLSGNAQWRSLLFLPALILLCSSCALRGVPALQEEVANLVLTDQTDQAAQKISEEKATYGSGNDLLYDLDRGLIELYARRHEASIQSFEKAKRRFEELYTQSLTKEALSWAVNDYMLPYRGADHEYVLINIFQALNFIALGKNDEALVEARDLSSKYQVVSTLANKAKRGHFEDNGFARLFMGLLYESTGRPQDRAEALLWYKEALSLYNSYYSGTYVPRVLQDRVLTLAAEFSDPELDALREGLKVKSLADMRGHLQKAQLVVIQFTGFSPVKTAVEVPIPIDGEIISKISLPEYVLRPFRVAGARVTVESAGRARQSVNTELGLDIEDLAIRDLESRKAITMAKALLRPTMKYLIERKQQENLAKHQGDWAGQAFGLFSSLYNIISEQADVRSWQALPAEIRVAQVWLAPGVSRVRWEDLDAQGGILGAQDLGDVTLRAGETRFIIVRSGR